MSERPDFAPLLLGTRGSKLALVQANAVAARLQEMGREVVLQVIRTAGDRGAQPVTGSAIGVFVKEIEQALLQGEVDLAVHSLKDVPTDERPGLVIAAIPERADPHDALVTRTGVGLAALPPGSTVASSSLRRTGQLKAYRPDLAFVPVRGNVDTRLRKLARGDFDALVLALAGLIRLGYQDQVTEVIPYDICLPAPGQGALAVQVRSDDASLRSLVGALDHTPSRLAVTAERSFLAQLGAGCTVPAGAVGLVQDDRFHLTGAVASADGRTLIRRRVIGAAQEAEALGRKLAEEMLAAGAGAIGEFGS